MSPRGQRGRCQVVVWRMHYTTLQYAVRKGWAESKTGTRALAVMLADPLGKTLATLRADLDAFVLQGWTPERPPIRRDKLVTALGSCFADEIRIWLRERGYRVNDDFRSGKSCAHPMLPLLYMHTRMHCARAHTRGERERWHSVRLSSPFLSFL